MSGPSPTPTKLRLVRGNPGKRPLNKKEPVPAAGAPDKPKCLTGEASKEWDRIIAQLDGMSLLYAVDGASLAIYCEAWGEFVEVLAELKKMGRITEGKAGQPYQHPLMGIKNKAADRVNRMAQQFGFSPAARTRIHVAEKESDNPLLELMKRDRSGG